MKRRYFLIVIYMLCSLVMVACGDENNTRSADREHYIIQDETEVLFSNETIHKEWSLLGTQYVDGQVVQIRADGRRNEASQSVLDIYLCRVDGSTELLIGNVSGDYRKSWCLGSDGNFLVYSGGDVTQLDKSGTVIFATRIDGIISDICQVSDDTIALLVYDMEEKGYYLAQIDAYTGEVDEGKSIYLGEGSYQYISKGENGVLLLNENGIVEVNLKNGSQIEIFSFVGSGYEMVDENGDEWSVSDFCVTGEGKAEVICGTTRLSLSRVNIAEVRDVLFVRVKSPTSEFEKCVAAFNKQNETYYVVVQIPDGQESADEFVQRTNIQLVAGDGADIIFGDAISDVDSLMEKGALLELSPYMEQSGIREKDYFPIAFDGWRDGEKIYGVQMSVQLKEKWIAKDFVEGIETLSIETLTDALLNYEENAVFNETWTAEMVLEYLLCGSEDIWGMIDWENVSCDFDGELFFKVLNVAKQYGDSEQNNSPSLSGWRMNANLYKFEYLAQLENEGKVPLGYFFDDGVHVTINPYRTMAINSNSPYIEGAWEFITYLLTEGQNLVTCDDGAHPVSRSAFDVLVQTEMKVGSVVSVEIKGKMRTTYRGGGGAIYREIGHDAYKALYDITDEKAEEVKSTLEDARALPIQIEPILDIICEEAAAYFSDSKSMEEVIAVIENRVGLYLSEHN